MTINLDNNEFLFDVSNIILLFFPRISTTDGSDNKHITVSIEDNYVKAVFKDNQITYSSKVQISSSLLDAKRCAYDRAVYNVCYKATGVRPPWGILIGVRPVKFYLKMKNLFGNDCDKILRNDYLVFPEKLELCKKVAESRKQSVNKLTEGSFSLYISVPFCPSRCKYCSFVSFSTENETKYIDNYVDVLCSEIQNTANSLFNKRPLTIYVGGGTPTSISDSLFEKILKCITDFFDTSECIEFTVEAGRPETISENKLKIMKRYGANRISVNPQTLSDAVLSASGRKHTVDDFYNAYFLADRYEFDINVDLIAGLPLETTDSFLSGLTKIINLSPANITIHSLYIKRAADYGLDRSLYSGVDPDAVTEMLLSACNVLDKNGFLPYYLYRQKNTVGNNENIGFSKKGKECAYNIYMMDDIQTVYACGANAMTKIVNNEGIIRSCGTKFAYNYILNKGEKNK